MRSIVAVELDGWSRAGTDLHVLRPYAERHAPIAGLAVARHRKGRGRRGGIACLERHPHTAVVRRRDSPGQEIHLRRTDEARDKAVLRPIVEIERRADLLDASARSTTILSAMVIASTWSCVT